MPHEQHPEQPGIWQEVGTILGVLIVDRVGRRKMLIQSTIQSLIAQVVLAIIFAVSTDSSTQIMGAVPARATIILVSFPLLHYLITSVIACNANKWFRRHLKGSCVVQICIFVFSYGYGWGPMGEASSMLTHQC